MHRDMLPHFIGIGPTKTATTWLFECLREHPEVFLPAVKETQFFVRSQYTDNLAEYEQFFAGTKGDHTVGEISPRYFASADAAERIHRHLPHTKLIITLRHPVERLESEYWHLRRMNIEVGDTSRNVPDTLEDALRTHEQSLIEPSLYAKHLQRWRERFDQSQMHIIFGEDVRTRPADVMRDVFAFLGVDPSFEPASLTEQSASVRKGVSPRTPMLGRMYSMVYSVLVRGVYRPARRVLGLKRAAAIKDAVRARQVMSTVFHRAGYPKMNARTRAMLLERFDADVRELETMTGRDLSAWRA